MSLTIKMVVVHDGRELDSQRVLITADNKEEMVRNLRKDSPYVDQARQLLLDVVSHLKEMT